jgi:hypothetical protein
MVQALADILLSHLPYIHVNCQEEGLVQDQPFCGQAGVDRWGAIVWQY